MDADTRALIRASILDEAAFVSATFSAAKKKSAAEWKTVTVRPVLLKRGRELKFSFFDGTKDITRNFGAADASAEIDSLAEMPFSSIQIESLANSFHVQITSKGKAILHKEGPTQVAADLAHNRTKDTILQAERDAEFLKAIGVLAADGNVMPSRRAKFRQINEFLKLFEHTRGQEPTDGNQSALQIVDFGCGSGHLTFAVHYYLNHILGEPAHTTGIDLKQELLARHRKTAASLNWRDIEFSTGAIQDAEIPDGLDIALALHACDTATDDALARAVKSGASIILAAPCCHHDLQVRLSRASQPAAMKPVLKNGILRERTADILTDTFRALILRILGYRTDIVEFVDAEHTDKNLMIRALKDGNRTASRAAKSEYEDLKTFWGVTPYLEDVLGADLITAP